MSETLRPRPGRLRCAWIEPEGKVHELGLEHRHERWAELRGETPDSLMLAGWIHLAADSLRGRVPMQGPALRSAQGCLADYPHTVWINLLYGGRYSSFHLEPHQLERRRVIRHPEG